MLLVNLGLVPQRRLVLPSGEAIKLAVRRGHGIAACTTDAVAEELEAGSLAIIPVRGWKLRRTFSAIRIRDAALTATARQFLMMLRARRDPQLARYSAAGSAPWKVFPSVRPFYLNPCR